MQAAELDYDDGTVRVQVAGDVKLNRSYGAVFSVRNEKLVAFVDQVISWAEEEGEIEEPVVELI